MKSFDFDCAFQSLVYNLNEKHVGKINSFFTQYSDNINKTVLEEGLKENRIALSDSILNKLHSYNSDLVGCNNE